MLKESDLIKDHDYVAKDVVVIPRIGILKKRTILKIDRNEGYVTYCEVKWGKKGISMNATIKTVSIKSFLKWAAADITKKE